MCILPVLKQVPSFVHQSVSILEMSHFQFKSLICRIFCNSNHLIHFFGGWLKGNSQLQRSSALCRWVTKAGRKFCRFTQFQIFILLFNQRLLYKFRNKICQFFPTLSHVTDFFVPLKIKGTKEHQILFFLKNHLLHCYRNSRNVTFKDIGNLTC